MNRLVLIFGFAVVLSGCGYNSMPRDYPGSPSSAYPWGGEEPHLPPPPLPEPKPLCDGCLPLWAVMSR